MRRKFGLAGAVALAGMLISALFAAQGSGAAAEVMIPRVIIPDNSTQFVSQPLVQPLPGVAGPSGVASPIGSNPEEPASLGDLVAAQPTEGALSAELRCLATAVYFEARGESLAGQLAVGRVIVNRAGSGRFPASYCGVVYQPSQFSFVRGRTTPKVPTGSRDWRAAVAIARIADKNTWSSAAPGALYFHAARVAPAWGRLTKLAQVDNHIFYR